MPPPPPNLAWQCPCKSIADRVRLIFPSCSYLYFWALGQRGDDDARAAPPRSADEKGGPGVGWDVGASARARRRFMERFGIWEEARGGGGGRVGMVTGTRGFWLWWPCGPWCPRAQGGNAAFSRGSGAALPTNQNRWIVFRATWLGSVMTPTGGSGSRARQRREY